MVYDIEKGKQLIDELINLWVETKIQCDKIEFLINQIKNRKIDAGSNI